MPKALTLPLFGRTAPGHRSAETYRDLIEHEEIILRWRGTATMHRIEITVAQDPLGEWWSSYAWHISAAVPSGCMGSSSPLDTLGPDKCSAIAKAITALAASLPTSYGGSAGRQVAQLRAQIAPLLRLAGGAGTTNA
jgi:hypothetical protein